MAAVIAQGALSDTQVGGKKVTLEEFYRELRDRNAERWGSWRFETVRSLSISLYCNSDLLSELIQNAEDSGASEVRFRVLTGGLLVWNNGRPFDEQDVRVISGLFDSAKGASEIGYFGMGFKSVLRVTRTPHVLSGPYTFRLEEGLDPHPVKPEELEPEAVRLWERGFTVFWLPSDGRPSGDWVDPTEEQLRKAGGELILFLDHLQTVSWEGRERYSWDAARENLGHGAQLVLLEFRADNDEDSEFWLRLDDSQVIPDAVIDRVIDAQDLGESLVRRWEQNRGRPVKFGVALGLGSDACTFRARDGKVFVGLPTAVETGLPFHVNGRFAVRLDRTGIDFDDPLSSWTLEQLERACGQLPDRLVHLGRFNPGFFRVVPLPGEPRDPFRKMGRALRERLAGGPFFHAESGDLRPRGQVFLADPEGLYELLSAADLEELTGQTGARWVAPELRSERPARVLRSEDIRVKAVTAADLARWLRGKAEDWWASRPAEWLRKLYRFCGRLPRPQQDAFRNLPLVRLRCGRQVRPEFAVFPPNLPEVVPAGWLELLPVADPGLSAGEEVRHALRSLGVAEFGYSPAEALIRLFRLDYAEGPRVDPETNRRHVRLLFELYSQAHLTWAILQPLKELPILRDDRGGWSRPTGLYLPPELGGSPEVSEYVRRWVGGRFVDPGYRTGNESSEKWGEALEALGVNRLPVVKECRWLSWSEARQWVEERRLGQLPDASPSYEQLFRVCEWRVAGLDAALEELSSRPRIQTAALIWNVLAELVDRRGEDIGQADFEYFRRGWKRWWSADAGWLLKLKNLSWLPDHRGNFCRPADLFDHRFRAVLGPNLPRLHDEIPTRQDKYRKLARMLGGIRGPEPGHVLDYLRGLSKRSDVRVQDVKPVYEWLCDHDHTEQLSRLTTEPLVFVPGRGWYRPDQVCWQDPTGTLPALAEEDEYHDLKKFFVDRLGVKEKPDAEICARYVLALPESGRPPQPQTLAPVARRILEDWEALPEDLKTRLKSCPCWPGRRGDEYLWERAENLVVNDHSHRAELFADRLVWWPFNELEELAEILGAARVSGAKLHVHYGGTPADDPEASGRVLWPAIRRFAGDTLFEGPPQVLTVGGLRVSYELLGRQSDPDDGVRGVLENGRLLVRAEGRQGRWLADAIGDALERATGLENLREFVKDIWEAGPDEAPELDRRWASRIGRDPGLAQCLKPAANAESPAAAPTGTEAGNGPKNAPAVTPDGPAGGYSARASWTLPADRPFDPSARPGGVGSGMRSVDSRWEDPRPAGRAGRPRGPLPEAGAEVARQAVELAIAWLESQGYRVEDVSGYGAGYDLVAAGPAGTVFVEVKGRSADGEVSLTENEWETARENGDRYWLLVIRTDLKRGWAVIHPAGALEPREEERVVREFHLPQWQWQGRGAEIRLDGLIADR